MPTHSYMYLWALRYENVPANDVSARISKSTKLSIYHVYHKHFKG